MTSDREDTRIGCHGAAAGPLAPIRLAVSVGPESLARPGRQRLIDFGSDEVEAASTLDDALDILGDSSRRVGVLLGYISFAEGWIFRLLDILRKHEAPFPVILRTRGPALTHPKLYGLGPTSYQGVAHVRNFFGDDSFTDVLRQVLGSGWTMRRILREGIAPPTMPDFTTWRIYGVAPGGQIQFDFDDRIGKFNHLSPSYLAQKRSQGP